jgi:hypothetical protein
VSLCHYQNPIDLKRNSFCLLQTLTIEIGRYRRDNKILIKSLETLFIHASTKRDKEIHHKSPSAQLKILTQLA